MFLLNTPPTLNEAHKTLGSQDPGSWDGLRIEEGCYTHFGGKFVGDSHLFEADNKICVHMKTNLL